MPSPIEGSCLDIYGNFTYVNNAYISSIALDKKIHIRNAKKEIILNQ